MRLDRIDIQAAPEDIWPYVADPVLVSAWNPKIIAVDRAIEGPVTAGERYETIFRMTSDDTECRAEVLEADAPRRVRTRLHYEFKGRSLHADETFTLSPRGDGLVHVEHEVDLRNAGVPLPFRVLAWIIMRIGSPVGEPSFVALKRMVEGE